MNDDAKKRKSEYNVERNKQLRQDKIIKDFKATLPYEEVEEINKTLNKLDMNKVQFIQWAYKKIKEKGVENNTDILIQGKRVLNKYLPAMTLQDRETIKNLIIEIDNIIKKDA